MPVNKCVKVFVAGPCGHSGTLGLRPRVLGPVTHTSYIHLLIRHTGNLSWKTKLLQSLFLFWRSECASVSSADGVLIEIRKKICTVAALPLFHVRFWAKTGTLGPIVAKYFVASLQPLSIVLLYCSLHNPLMRLATPRRSTSLPLHSVLC